MRAPRTSRGPPAVLLMLLLAVGCTGGYKPVIIVHGIFDGPKQFENLSMFIKKQRDLNVVSKTVKRSVLPPKDKHQTHKTNSKGPSMEPWGTPKKVHPGTEVPIISLYNYKCSLKPLWVQVQDFRKAIEDTMKKFPEGVHLLCFSQAVTVAVITTSADLDNVESVAGGLICRAVLSTSPNHNVHTFISLSSPLAGQYGDPHHRAGYLRSNTFLPLVNGEKPHKFITDWRENVLRIKKMVLIGGPDDGVITPWQSSHYGFYDTNEDVVEMRNQEFYKNDTFGLKTLDARGDVSVCVQSGVEHTHWHSNFTVFTNCIEKWLI
ncbi:hypothetical protein CRENBAI_016305 [Crenichthys baileyi]|uniref:palmitoyl-CoA hydrolase n=1 Tax=Crenichthys baileyi TaxID=28760 RepID=A0AAV9RU58_9TELE